MQRFGENGIRNLPAYSVYNAALEYRPSASVKLTLLATNIANTYSGDFVSSRFSVPLATSHGPMLPTLAAPLTGARLFFNANFKISHGE